MDELFEFIVELLFEAGGEVATNKKVSKWIRYPILIIMCSFFAIVIGGIIILGISTIKENILVASIFIALGLFLLIGSILKLKKYINKK